MERHDEGDARVGRHATEQCAQRLEPAGRGADADDERQRVRRAPFDSVLLLLFVFLHAHLTKVTTTPSMRSSAVRYGRRRTVTAPPSRALTSRSTGERSVSTRRTSSSSSS